MKYVHATDREIIGYEWRSQDASPTTRSHEDMNAEAKVYEAITDAANKAAAEARTGNLGITKSDKAENPAEATDQYFTNPQRRQVRQQPMLDKYAKAWADGRVPVIEPSVLAGEFTGTLTYDPNLMNDKEKGEATKQALRQEELDRGTSRYKDERSPTVTQPMLDKYDAAFMDGRR